MTLGRETQTHRDVDPTIGDVEVFDDFGGNEVGLQIGVDVIGDRLFDLATGQR